MNKRMRSERGAALVEAAMILPLIMLISVGIFEFGRAYQTSQVLTNAAREGARLAVIEGRTDGDVRARVNKYVTDGGLTALIDANIQLNRTVALSGTATASSVTITYPFEFMMLNPIVRMVTPTSTTGAPITLTAVSLMRNE
jgi:Flp pilus assembly protein TadG